MRIIRTIIGIISMASYHKGIGWFLFAIKYNLGIAKEGIDFWTEGVTYKDTKEDAEFWEKYYSGSAQEGIDFITH